MRVQSRPHPPCKGSHLPQPPSGLPSAPLWGLSTSHVSGLRSLSILVACEQNLFLAELRQGGIFPAELSPRQQHEHLEATGDCVSRRRPRAWLADQFQPTALFPGPGWCVCAFEGVLLACVLCLTCHCPAVSGSSLVVVRLPRLPLSTPSGSSCTSCLISAPLATKLLSLVVGRSPILSVPCRAE